MAGVDVDLGYRWKIQDAGNFKADLHWTRLTKFEDITVDGSQRDFVGTHGNCDVSNCIGTPRNKVNVSGTWETATFGVTATVNWRSSLENVGDNSDPTCLSLARLDGSTDCAKLPSFYTMDLTGRLNINKNLQIYGSINNLFDRHNIVGVSPATKVANPPAAPGDFLTLMAGRSVSLSATFGYAPKK